MHKYLVLAFLLFVLLPCFTMGQADSAKMSYTTAIAKGDSLFNARYYFIAILAYAVANQIDSSQPYPKSQLKKIMAFYEKTQTYNKFTYRHVTTDADNYFYQKDWVNAKKKYEEAFEMKPDCTSCLESIKACDSLILNNK